MTLNEYFKLPDTPSKGSPVGRLMQAIIEKEPTLRFEEARERANSLLNKAAGKKRYALPRIQTTEQMEKERQRLAKLSMRGRPTAGNATAAASEGSK